MTDRYWVLYRASQPGTTSVRNRTGFIDSLAQASAVAADLAKIKHVHEISIQKITTVMEWDK